MCRLKEEDNVIPNETRKEIFWFLYKQSSISWDTRYTFTKMKNKTFRDVGW